MEEKIINKLEGIKGDISFYYKNLITEETIKYNEKHEMLAASIIKLPILVECFNQINKRIVNKDDIFITKDKKVYTTSNLKGKLNLKNESFKLMN